MTYKLNSFKTYKDNWELIVIGMIIALFMMLLPLTWKGEVKAESDLEIVEENVEEIEREREPWILTEDGDHQEMPPIQATTEHEKFKELAAAYWLDASMFRTLENHYWLTEWLTLCLVISETSWGHRGYWVKWCNNLGNVWNNDRGDRICFAFMETWLEKIGQTLTNKYLGKKQTLGCLSNAWHCVENWDNWARYATSTYTREKNMVTCLSTIYGKIDPSTFNIRQR